MELITSKRFLVRSLFDGERICQLRLVDLTGLLLKVVPFDTETPATVFIDARVVLFDRSKIERDNPAGFADIAETGYTTGIKNILYPLLEEGMGETPLSRYMAEPDETNSSSVMAVAY